MKSFEALGLQDSATPDEVKAAWRKLAAIHHPDAGGDAAEFARLNAAYKQSLEHAEAVFKMCPTCHGSRVERVSSGFSSIEMPCSTCGGEGSI